MKETMNKTQETPIDTDSDVTPQEVVVSPDNSTLLKEEKNIKEENKEENCSESLKSERRNSDGIRVSYFNLSFNTGCLTRNCKVHIGEF